MDGELISKLPGAPSEPGASPAERHIWQQVERLSDLLAETTDLPSAIRQGLQFILQAAGCASGLLLVQSLAEVAPALHASVNISPAWAEQVNVAASPLRRLARQSMAGVEQRDPGSLGLAAALPLVAPSGVQGVLLVQGDPLPLESLQLLEALARPLGRHIRQARHFHTGPTGDLPALQTVVSALSLNHETFETQPQIIPGICQVLDAEVAALILLDEERHEIITRKTVNAQGEWVYQVDLKLGNGPSDSLVKDCLRTNQPLRENNIHDTSRPTSNGEVRSILVAPLRSRGQVIGVLQAWNKRAGQFDEYDQAVLSLIADLTAQTLYSKRLIQQLQVANADLEASHWELLRSRNTLRALFDSIPAALYIIDRQYTLMAINASCADRTGKMPQTLVGRLCYEALYNRQGPCPGCRVSETLQHGENTARTERRWDDQEEPTEWEISTYPICDENEQVVQAILLEQDVTEKRRLENVLAQSEKLAAVGQLAAGVAHEINNPLTAIIANAQIMQREVPADSEIQESIDLIARAGARATQVVRNLLDFARKDEVHLALTDVNETVQRSLALVQHELLARSLTLKFDPAPDLPDIMASQDHLQGVWLNLLMNAIDSIENRPGMLHVSTREVDGEIQVSIEDNGKGIPPERLARIFEPFYTTKAPGRGTGLGLSVCDRLIKQHGGRILVESELGAGSRFTVILPLGRRVTSV